jgi:dihydropyrimidinase
MEYDLVIRNGRIVTSDSDFVGDLAVSGEKIAALGQGLSGRREIDATGKLVVPGAIDGHVHMRTERPSWSYDETFASGSVAAAFGGTTTMIDQVQVEPGQTLNQGLDKRLEVARGKTAIDYTFHMNIREPETDRLEEIPSIFDRGITSFKWFMAIEGWRVPEGFLLRGMYEVAEQGGLSVIHTETQGIINEMKRRAKAEGRTQVKYFESMYPAPTEGAAAELALAMAEISGSRVLIFHVTCSQVVDALRRARDREVEASGELGLGWALFTGEVYDGNPVTALPFLLTPPVRGKSHQEDLWKALAEGTLNVIGTDHTAMWMRPEEEALEFVWENFCLKPEIPQNDESVPTDAKGNRLLPMLPPGGAEVRLPMMYTHGVREGRIDLHQWVNVCCANPARVYDLDTKGQLLPGYEADVVIFDPEKEVTVSVKDLHSNTDYSVYEGMTMHGAVIKTISRGKVIVDEGEFVGSQDHGRFVKRTVA